MSNDVIPSTIHISALISIKDHLIPSLELLHTTILQKTVEFDEIKKIGRTHLQDAVPMTLGQEFSGYARQIELGIKRIKAIEERLSELALGGTAIGTGLVPHIGYDRAAAIAKKAHKTGKTIREIVSKEEILPESVLTRIFNDQ